MEQRKNKISPRKDLSDKKLPWWVELLFVQIGLPDKWLAKFLKTNKNIREICKNEKKALITFIFFILALGYFQPVINHSKTKLRCQNNVKSYIKENYLSTFNEEIATIYAINYCNGGTDIESLLTDKD